MWIVSRRRGARAERPLEQCAKLSGVSIMSKFWIAARKLPRQTSFVIAAFVLLLAALTLNAATEFLQLHFKKLPVPLAHSLSTVPDQLGPWICVIHNEQINPELEQTLGTKQYIFRDYVDSRHVSTEQIKQFESLDIDAKTRLLGEMESQHPEWVVNFAVTYYTGKADTVAHIPDRCYVADGYEPTSYNIVNWDIKDHQTRDGHIEARFIQFSDDSGQRRVPKSVAYFFHCNGSYASDPIAVRGKLQNLRAKYVYYSKVELMTFVSDPARCAEVMTDFLTDAMPQVEKALPDWSRYANR
jgi:hypothetical protein